ncbi:MAG: precorrin-4 C(11)-methyltransferase, partial [Lachnospiraceae bacterium]|nr:precorrin-4 C(11)-methyltransferase [Lachnospiraceae bacterium]
MVHFVGAGPGAEDLITVRGAGLLKEADIVIYAGSLVNPLILGLCRDDAKLYDSAGMTLKEVIELISDAESQSNGIRIVRLHSGDFGLYGAVKEQIAELKRLGISYDLTPGVSSFNASASVLETEYTPAGISQSVIITRMEGRTSVPEKEKLSMLASHGASMVIFLSMGLIGRVQEELLRGGAYDDDTPAAIVYKVTWKEERIFKCRLSELEKTAKENGISRTALIIVGDFLGDGFETSRLYADDFSTGYRKGKKAGGIRMIAFTDRGEALAFKIRDGLIQNPHSFHSGPGSEKKSLGEAEDSCTIPVINNDKKRSETITEEPYISVTRGGRDITLENWVKQNFYEADALVFIGALGIAVRAAAPFIRNKAHDPAVVSVDEAGKHVISVLSGHIGGANELSERIAEITGGDAVITTATDLNGKFAVDNWAKEQELVIINPEKIKSISSAVLKGQEILFESLYPIDREGNLLPAAFRDTDSCVSSEALNGINQKKAVNRDFYRYIFNGDEFTEACGTDLQGSAAAALDLPLVYIGVKDTDKDCLKLCPKRGALGIGCRKGTAMERIETSFRKFLKDNRLLYESIGIVASIDLKKEEEGLLAFCKKHGFRTVFYSAEQLNGISG